MTAPLRTEEVFSTPWFTLIARSARDDTDPHYAISTDDYVTILAVTSDDKVVLVRQFRHAVTAETLELPAGHVDGGETPNDAARRELLEETGYQADTMELLGCLRPDTGRLANRMWGFYAHDVAPPKADFHPESGIEVTTCSRRDLFEKIRNGEFDHALHHAVLFLAVLHKKLSLGEDKNG